MRYRNPRRMRRGVSGGPPPLCLQGTTQSSPSRGVRRMWRSETMRKGAPHSAAQAGRRTSGGFSSRPARATTSSSTLRTHLGWSCWWTGVWAAAQARWATRASTAPAPADSRSPRWRQTVPRSTNYTSTPAAYEPRLATTESPLAMAAGIWYSVSIATGPALLVRGPMGSAGVEGAQRVPGQGVVLPEGLAIGPRAGEGGELADARERTQRVALRMRTARGVDHAEVAGRDP